MRLLDIARSAYVSSPVGFRRSIAPLMAMVPTSFKYGGQYKSWRATIERSCHDPEFVERQRQRGLRSLLSLAYDGSSYHRDRMIKSLGAGWRPESATEVDLASLPVSTKEALSEAGETALAVPRNELDRGDTSGSNGEAPFGFWLDRDRSVREIAFIHSIWSRCGYKPGDARAMLRDAYLYNEVGLIHEWEAALGELRLSVFPMTPGDIDLYLDLIDRREIRYLHGFPSAIEMMARHMISTGRRLALPLKGVMPISEPIYAHQRRIIELAFGTMPIIPFYGMSEKAIFAGEVEGQEGVYECEPLYGIAELVDEDGAPVTEAGVEGRLVGTSFITRGMPFIRYDTQDRAVLVRAAAPANGWRMRVRDIAPRRKPAFLVDHDGRRVVTTDFTPSDPAFFEGVKEFQFFQERKGHCVIRYVSSSNGECQKPQQILKHLQDKAGQTIQFELEEVPTLVASSNGKRPFVDQRLTL